GLRPGARRQRARDASPAPAGFAGLVAHRGHLFARGACVLGCDQGVGLGGDFRQFGDDFLLLGQIESHCTPPSELRSRLLPLAVLGGAFLAPGTLAHPCGGLLQKTSRGGTIYAGSCPEGPGLSDPASNATTPCRTELPCPSCCAQTAPAVFDGCRLGMESPGDALKIPFAACAAPTSAPASTGPRSRRGPWSS